MKAYEEHHNDAEQVETYLRGALALVDELAPPDDLRPHLFVKAVDLLSSKQIGIVPDSAVVPAQLIPGRPLG